MKAQVAVLLLVAGCSDGRSPSPSGGDDMKSTVNHCIADGKTISVTGRYGVLATLQVDIQVPPACAKTATCLVHTNGASSLLLLADIVQNGTRAEVVTQSCDIHIPQVPIKGADLPIVLKAPSSLLGLIPPAQSTATLETTTTCSKFLSQPLTFIFGANLAAPTMDELPAYSPKNMPSINYCDANPAVMCATSRMPTPPQDTGCVCDQEGDSHAGATLTAMNIPVLSDIDRVYVNLRNSVILSGLVLSTDPGATQASIGGKVLGLRMEQNILGCHRSGPNRDCNNDETNAAATLAPGILQSTNGESTFVALPVPPSTTCAELIAKRQTLFSE